MEKQWKSKNRDYIGMKRYSCQSHLMVSSMTKENNRALVTIHLEHHECHVPYYDVALLPEASEIIRNNLILASTTSELCSSHSS
jgi:hypothetical protein